MFWDGPVTRPECILASHPVTAGPAALVTLIKINRQLMAGWMDG